MAQKKKKQKPLAPKDRKKRASLSQIAFYALGIIVILSMVLTLFMR